MELRHLRYFIAVAEEENVSRAALKLYVSQPGISRQIRDLEEEIGFPLFERTAKSIKLTESGKIFLQEARAVLSRVDEAVKKARMAAGGMKGELHIGYAPSLTARFLPQTLRAFQSKWPNVRVKLHDFSTEEMLAGLRKRKLQLAFMVRGTRAILRGLEFTELSHDMLCLAVAPKHRLAGRKTISLAEAASEPLISYNREDYPDAYELVASIFAGTKKKPRIAEEHDSVSSLIAAVEAGNGVAIAAQSLACMAGPRLKLISLSPAPAPLAVGAAWMEKGLTTTAAQLLEIAKTIAQKNR